MVNIMNFFIQLFGIYTQKHHEIPFDYHEERSGFCDHVMDYHIAHYWEAIWEPTFIELKIMIVQPSNNHCIEIKRIKKAYNHLQIHNANDFYSSWQDGRLYTQAKDRNENFQWSGMILEKEPGATINNMILTKDKLAKVFNTLVYSLNQHIIETQSFDFSLQVILEIFLTSIDSKDHSDPTNKEKKPTALIDQQRYFLSGLIGCGKKQSLILLQIFKTPLCILKWILETQLTYTRNNKLKGTNSNVPDFGPTFFQNNQRLLTTQAKEIS